MTNRIKEILDTYNIVWNSQSRDAGESMPAGGHDIGCNVWVEKGELYIYMAQSGAFDEEGRMCKAGRLRISMNPNPFRKCFRQELKLYEGYIEIQGELNGNAVLVKIWANVRTSVVNIEVQAETEVEISCVYENWRLSNSALKYKDVLEKSREGILFYHQNQDSEVFHERIEEQGIQDIAAFFPDVQKNRIFGGMLIAGGMEAAGEVQGTYAGIPYAGCLLESKKPVLNQKIQVYLHISQAGDIRTWKKQLESMVEENASADNGHEKSAQQWWAAFWNRSYVFINSADQEHKGVDWQAGRNYQLFRYMLACNAYGEYPTKFNGGLFTVDPPFWKTRQGAIYPDDRDWGGLIFTAQNQRLVYWPQIRNGDFDMMAPQFNFYKRILDGVRHWTQHFFGIPDAACFAEQIDANGLSAFYGKGGVDFPMQVRHHYVEALEFCFMILKYAQASGNDISEYMEFISCVVNFYDRKYNVKDGKGKRILFPSTALETYHTAEDVGLRGKEGVEASNYNDEETAVTNPADVIAALHDVLTQLLCSQNGTLEQRAAWRCFLEALPAIPVESKYGHKVIAPCESPRNYVKINCEFPQMNVVYPYNIYGINKPDLELAADTFHYAWDAPDQLDYISWQLPGVYAARVGLAGEAQKYMRLKLGDSGRRFPAFWGPGHDYVPDHNWGGCGMINVQEMLMQVLDGKIYLLPAWPAELDVSYKLWADARTVVEVNYTDGQLEYKVTPEEREKDIILSCLRCAGTLWETAGKPHGTPWTDGPRR